jgi:hypothetical protein
LYGALAKPKGQPMDMIERIGITIIPTGDRRI